MHYAPNAARDYDLGNPHPVPSECYDWLHFPDFQGDVRQISASEWGGGSETRLPALVAESPAEDGRTPERNPQQLVAVRGQSGQCAGVSEKTREALHAERLSCSLSRSSLDSLADDDSNIIQQRAAVGEVADAEQDLLDQRPPAPGHGFLARCPPVRQAQRTRLSGWRPR